ncbi:MAG: hypothetical protein PVG32_18935 [Anaerolineales bacterium]|jgi:hypothetical protein
MVVVSSDSYPLSKTYSGPEISSTSMNASELSRLINAAVVNQRFRRLLLSDPARALVDGYNGEGFRLDAEILDLVLSIRASDLTEFARLLVTGKNGDGVRDNGQRRSNGGY